MYYHAALLFDHEEFSIEAKPLGLSFEKGDVKELNERITGITSNIRDEDFILKDFGFGSTLKEIVPLNTSTEIQFLNFEIGKRFLILLSQFLFFCSVHIGYNWKKLVSLLESAEWSQADINTLIYGYPIGILVTGQAKDSTQLDIVTHQDPYWRWIRPLYSHSQGGWISYHECVRLYDKLNTLIIEKLPKPQDFYDEMNAMKIIQDAKEMLSLAIKEQKGLYVIVLWEW